MTAAAALGWLAWRRATSPEQRDTLFWMALGATGYAIGQIIWNVQVFVGFLPFPGPSDVFSLTLGPCMLTALVRILLRIDNVSRRMAALLDSATISVAVLTLTLVLYLPNRSNTTDLALATLIAYPVTQFSAVAALAVGIPTLRLRITRATSILFLGLFGTALIWMRWNYLALDGLNIPGSRYNLIFSVAVLMIGYGLTHWDQAVDNSSRWERFCEGLLRQLPLLVVVLSAGAVVLAHYWRGLPTVVVNASDVGAVIVTLLAMFRQGTLLREHDELIATQEELNKSQLALSMEQAQLKALLTAMPDMVWLKDPEGVYLMCNRAFENFFGSDEKDIAGKTDYDFVPQEVADSFRQNDRLAIDSGGERRNEEALTFLRGGYEGIFETTKTPMRDVNGALIGVLGISRDISKRKQSEEQLSINAAILANLTEGIQLAQADTQMIVYANRQLEKLFGYPAGDLLGKHISVLHNPGDSHAEETLRDIRSSLELTGAWEGDEHNARQDGTLFWSHVTISTFHHPEYGKVWISAHEDATARKLADEEIRNLAFYDPLTKLPNRRLMMDRSQQALAASSRTGRKLAMLLIDLDDFKVINDTLGHDAGDQLLVSVANRLMGCMREGDTVARLGGDEFVVIISNLDADENGLIQAETVARKVHNTLNAPYDLSTTSQDNAWQQHSHTCSPSIGVCMPDSNHVSVDEILKHADIAMYQAKRAGRNCIRFYDPIMQDIIKARVTLEAEIRNAVSSEQFLPYYQPQVDNSGTLIGAEVLVRWQHPERGVILPGVFITLAEDTGLIVPIGRMVLLSACRQLAQWRQESQFSSLVLSVNVSAQQMSSPTFEQELVAMIAAFGISSECLKLELTEGALLTNTEDVISKMRTLRDHGVLFSLDDFGTGYSSLSYLKHLPITQVKIDQSFIRDLLTESNDEAIAKTIVTLGHSLGLHVIAEGVESDEQRTLLRSFGCDAYQGYYFGHPMPVARFEQWVHEWQGRTVMTQ